MKRAQDLPQNALVTRESPFLVISLVYHMALQKATKSALQFGYKFVTDDYLSRKWAASSLRFKLVWYWSRSLASLATISII